MYIYTVASSWPRSFPVYFRECTWGEPGNEASCHQEATRNAVGKEQSRHCIRKDFKEINSHAKCYYIKISGSLLHRRCLVEKDWHLT